LELAEAGAEPRTDRPAPRGAGATAAPATPAEARPRHVRALEGTQRLEADSALALLERQNFAPSYLQRTSRTERLELVRRVRDAAAASGNVLVREDDAGVHLMLQGDAGLEVTFTMEDAAPFRIATIRTAPLTPRERRPAGPPITWDNLRERLAAAAAEGFSGQVLVRRQGKEILRMTYGFSDSSTKRRTAPDDIYCIGSAPIDFTISAAKLLAQRGKLALDEPIGRYVSGVPLDKASMTARMLMEGRSGLPDFHDEDGDWDKDLAWIDRETAVRRILSRPLLFQPGARRQHSHSAYGLLAAIVEVVSGTTYAEFVRAEILRPLGMTRTGFYGETLGLPATAFATGYGANAVGAPNIPPNWGPTSWLVMGSGGMFSTLDDMRRYNDAMASGALIPGGKPTTRRGIEVDGSDRGFYLTRIDNGNGDVVLLLSNTETSPATRALADGLVPLVMGPR
jgi:CubicO group peptidase (beta-lactamase class C family)